MMLPTDTAPQAAEPVRQPWTTPRVEKLGDMRDVRNLQQSTDDGSFAGSLAASAS